MNTRAAEYAAEIAANRKRAAEEAANREAVGLLSLPPSYGPQPTGILDVAQTINVPTPRLKPNQLDMVLNKVGKNKGVAPENIRKFILDPIAYHETGGTMDPTTVQRTRNDTGDERTGIGRGLYQFEGAKKDGMAFKSAIVRAERWYKNNDLNVPNWLSSIGDNDDARSLTPDQQSILAITNFEEKEVRGERPKIEDVIKGDMDLTDFWLKYHWIGNKKGKTAEAFEKEKAKRRKSFAEKYKNYSKKMSMFYK